jgi:hypothetical protein
VAVVFLCLCGLCGFLTVIGDALFRLCVFGVVSVVVVDSLVRLLAVARVCLIGLGGFLTVIVVCLLRFDVVLVLKLGVSNASVLLLRCSSSEVQSDS